MNITNFGESISTLVARDDLKGAIIQLQQLLQDSPQLDEVIMQSAQLSDMTRQIRNGTISFQEADISKNRIRSAILSLAAEIEESVASHTELKHEFNQHAEEVAGRLARIETTSLAIKKDLRDEERAELVAFRVALERWEDALQTLLFDFTMLSASEARIAPFYEKDKQLFLEVKIAVVKVGIYLRSKELEQQLMAAVTKIRQTYYPPIMAAMPTLMDIQAQLLPIDLKMKAFESSPLQNPSTGPTPQDRELHLSLQQMMTAETATFAQNLLETYRNVAEQLYEVKEAINQYIYRRISHVDIDKD